MLFCEPDGIHGGVDGSDSSSQCPACQQAVPLSGTGDTQEVSVAGDQDAGSLGKVQYHIDHVCRGDADRASGTGQEPDRFRKDTFQPAPGDRHGVGPADLHQPDRTGDFGEFADLIQDAFRVFWVLKLTFTEHF